MSLWNVIKYRVSNGRITSAFIRGNIQKGTKVKLPLPSGHYAIFKAVNYDNGVTTLVRIKTIHSLDKLFESITID